MKCCIVRIEDISLLEACLNYTLVHFFDGRLLIRRTLGDCERRLDNSTFFRASSFLGGKPFSSVRHEVSDSGLQALQDIQEIRVWP